MSDNNDRKDEFDAKIGEKEEDFCSVCKKTTSQRWIRERTSSFLSTDYYYYLRCKECGNKTCVHHIHY